MNPYYIYVEDRELNLKETLRFILKHWKKLIIAGIVCAILLVSFKSAPYIQRPSTVREAKETEAEEVLQDYNAESELYSNSVRKMGTLFGAENEYLKSSVLMSIDPYHVPTASTEIIIGTVKGERATAALVADELKRDLLQGDYLESLKQQTSIESVSLMLELMEITVIEVPTVAGSLNESELIDTKNESSSNQLLPGSVKLDVNVSVPEPVSDETNFYKITLNAIGTDQKQANTILDGMIKEAEKKEKKLDEKYRFTVQTKDKKSGIRINRKVEQFQKNYLNSIAALSSVKNTLDTSQTSLQKPSTFDLLGNSLSKKTLVKYAGIGFVIGIFLAALFYLLRYINNDVLCSYEDLSMRFRLQNIGLYDGTDDSADMIDANIHNYSPDARRILLVGTAGEDELNRIKEKIQPGDSTLTIETCGDILTSADARHKLSKEAAAVLVEKRGSSRYHNIEQEIEILYNAHLNVAGIIIC